MKTPRHSAIAPAALGLLFALLATALPTSAQVVERWVQRYNGPAHSLDDGNAVAVDGSGNVVVTGSSFNAANTGDYYTAKYATGDGTLLWEKRYNGPANGDERAYSVAVDGSGNVVVTGYSENATNVDYYTAKYAAGNGTLLWEKRYNGPANLDDSIQWHKQLALTPDGGVVVTGSSDDIGRDYATVYYTSTLPVVTTTAATAITATTATLNGTVNPNGFATTAQFAYGLTTSYGSNASVTLSPNNGTTAQSVSANLTGLLAGSTYHYRLTATNAQGTAVTGDGIFRAADAPAMPLRWQQLYTGTPGGGDSANAVVVDGAGNSIVTGKSVHAGGAGPSATHDLYTAKYAPNGTLLWQKTYNGPGDNDDTGQGVAVDAAGNVITPSA